MSDNAPTSITATRARMLVWLARGCDDAFLGTESKDELQRKLRDWIDRRFANYAAIKELRRTCQQATESIMDQLQNGAMPDRASILHTLQMSERLNEHAEVLDGQREKMNTEATYLVQTLKVKHGVHWENIRPEPKTDADHLVVGALMALGQQDITMQTLIDLEDEEDEDHLRENRERQAVIMNGVLDILRRQPA
ncbi:uncharacterized protein LTHEOB_9857 [Lasiodiplodia theobromae]|uniref:uncharacterized protein n=1 Tax=Lasiodiplodia theobromae TaxID=45133 RepID=UPI0015C3F042|nr:uncharacterized protein LTHEOB_9857 [Lasiodiplodia theobromae]KAF4539739.1 hypothetical protein LTHEOB_9857 [Lasiodiplodia theobromae]